MCHLPLAELFTLTDFLTMGAQTFLCLCMLFVAATCKDM